MSCDWFEGKMLALFAEIEATRDHPLARNMSNVHLTLGLKAIGS